MGRQIYRGRMVSRSLSSAGPDVSAFLFAMVIRFSLLWVAPEEPPPHSTVQKQSTRVQSTKVDRQFPAKQTARLASQLISSRVIEKRRSTHPPTSEHTSRGTQWQKLKKKEESPNNSRSLTMVASHPLPLLLCPWPLSTAPSQ